MELICIKSDEKVEIKTSTKTEKRFGVSNPPPQKADERQREEEKEESLREVERSHPTQQKLGKSS
ncbi:hypothetical protein HPP92_005674 [Vanilla planifolia]|uniref:Uncharacterized protein n=1 Tax=Vanilla planifolia TaxID=51239 RepID=A0A835VD48_VANPL|nr:hypothetical protein HPP92_005993 [Vanilla planifolia]KAG0494680.1 hypothetical protein HPP92_005674 [Vanilla planifolia]